VSELSIKFVDRASQAVWLGRLASLCARLVAEGLLTRAQAQAVFPDDPDPNMAALFTVDVAGNAGAALTRFRRLDGVGWAQEAGKRRSLAGPPALRERRLRRSA
jgi:hypothetical protein